MLSGGAVLARVSRRRCEEQADCGLSGYASDALGGLQRDCLDGRLVLPAAALLQEVSQYTRYPPGVDGLIG